jgi:hypothetical protein
MWNLKIYFYKKIKNVTSQERFLKMVFRVSGFDRFSPFERILQFETESVFDRPEVIGEIFKSGFRFSGFDRFPLFERI